MTDATPRLTVNADQFTNLLLVGLPGHGHLLAANDTIVIDGADGTLAAGANLGTLSAFHTSGVVAGMILGGAQNNGSYTVNLGTSGETSITMEGTGHQQITGHTGTKETFVMGLSATGGSTIINLDANDKDIVDVGTGISLTTRVGTGAQVTGTGQWAFGADHVLTWWDSGHGKVDTLSLQLAVNATDLKITAGHTFTVI